MPVNPQNLKNQKFNPYLPIFCVFMTKYSKIKARACIIKTNHASTIIYLGNQISLTFRRLGSMVHLNLMLESKFCKFHNTTNLTQCIRTNVMGSMKRLVFIFQFMRQYQTWKIALLKELLLLQIKSTLGKVRKNTIYSTKSLKYYFNSVITHFR